MGFYQQRRVFGGTKNNPARLYYSEIGDYLAFAGETRLQKDDGPIVAILASGEADSIRHLVSLNELTILTDSTQWLVRANLGEAFTAKTIKQDAQIRIGSTHIPPDIFDDTVVYVREGNRSVIGLLYSDQREGYAPAELSLLSNHLFLQSSIIDTAALLVPSKQLVCIRNDGDVGYLTFNADHKITAWTRWDTDGLFESVAIARPILSKDILDAAYFVVRRVINGQVVRYIERTDSRQFEDVEDCYFVDAGLTYDNPIKITDIALGEATTVTAAGHGLGVGYEINFSDIQWEKKYDEFFTEIPLDQLNKQKYKVKSVSGSTFTLGDFDDNSDVDSAGFTRYIDGGKVRSMVKTLRGLWYLEGKKVAVLADGNMIENLVVNGGKVELSYRYGRIQIGLPYISEIETLPLSVQDPSLMGTPKSLTEVLMRVYRSRGLLLRHVDGGFYELPMRTDEDFGSPTKLLTGDAVIPMTSQWGIDGAFIVRQPYPLPMGILSALPVFTTGDGK